MTGIVIDADFMQSIVANVRIFSITYKETPADDIETR